MTRTICDLHIHTKFSCDSTADLESYCLRALQEDVGIICFTDHVDNNPHDDGYGFYKTESFFNEYYKVKEKYGKKLTVLCGIEFGEPHKYPDTLAELSSLDYDFILASVHFWYNNMYPDLMRDTGVSASKCYEYYWDEVLKTVQSGGFDSLGHMDFPKRYYNKLVFDSNKLSVIFRELVSKNISLEINTSNLRMNMTETMPDRELLSIYRDCGGKYVTIGSDAHRDEDLAANNSYAQELLEYYGFEEVYYSQRTRFSV